MKRLDARARINEVDGLSDAIVRGYKADEKVQKDAFVATTMGEVEDLSAKITTAFMQDKALSTLDSADAERDNAIKTLGTMLTAYAVFPIASKKDAAIPLKAIYEKYAKSGITSANYVSESSMTESLLEDLKADSMAGNIAALEGVAEAIANIRATQDAFTATSDAYAKASASKPESASSYKKPLLAAINDKLVPYLTAVHDVTAQFSVATGCTFSGTSGGTSYNDASEFFAAAKSSSSGSKIVLRK